MDNIPSEHSPDVAPVMIRCGLAGGFSEWMSRAGGTIFITTYQAGKVVLVGWDGQRVTLLPRHFDRPMGLAVSGPRVALACRRHLHLLADSKALACEFQEDQPGKYDALYLPRVAYHTGQLNVHDVAFGTDGIWMVNTLFSCLASPGVDTCFVPRWRPPFITATIPEDRCHLNGLAMENGHPRFVTALGNSNEAGGWRDGKRAGGILFDIPAGQIALGGLCMPHSPRVHDGQIWLLNSGAGELWRIDPRTFQHDIVCTLPGYLRGLCFVGPYALVGLCMLREKSNSLFGSLPVRERFTLLRCAVAIVDLRTGQEIGRLDFVEGCTEIYDVQFAPGVHQPMILNVEHRAFGDAYPCTETSFWIRPGTRIGSNAVDITQAQELVMRQQQTKGEM